MDRKREPVIFEDFDEIQMEDLDFILSTPLEPAEKKTELKEEKSAEPETGGKAEAETEAEETAEPVSAEEIPAGEEKAVTELPEEENREPSAEATQPEAEQEAAGSTAGQTAAEQKAAAAKPDRHSKPQKTVKTGKKPEKKKTVRTILTVLAAVLAAAAIGAYGYGVYFYTYHFLPWTVAEGVYLDNLTLEEAQKKLTDSRIEEDSVLLLHTLEGNTVEMSTGAMAIRRNYLGLPGALEAQEKWIFPVSRNREKKLEFPYEVVCDAGAAIEELEKLEICSPEKMQAPVDSYVEKNKKGAWEVVLPVDGNTIDCEALAGLVGQAVMNREKEIDLVEAGVYLRAGIREDDPALNCRAERENRIDALELSVDLGADTAVKITPDEFRGLLTADAWNTEAGEESAGETGLIDEKKFADYLFRLAVNYNTKAASGWRTFRSVSGDAIVLQSNYGWEMDKEATGSLLKKLLEDAARSVFIDENAEQTFPDGTVKAVWTQEAISHGERDTGDSWVEVDITTQKLYCVMNGETVLESNVVTGMEMNRGRRTPAGIFAVRFKQRERDLVGYNSDGTESYRSHVSYWMPVYNNIGLHDASWRGSFGGNVYVWSGSHGCVNLPVKTAKTLYDLVEKGTPVIIYRESVNGSVNGDGSL